VPKWMARWLQSQLCPDFKRVQKPSRFETLLTALPCLVPCLVPGANSIPRQTNTVWLVIMIRSTDHARTSSDGRQKGCS
jgi:hypothetical protein